jgi:hypothetical protein
VFSKFQTVSLIGFNMTNKPEEAYSVSSNNPCPFLRALVAEGKLSDVREPLEKVAEVIVATVSKGEGNPALPRRLVFGIGLIANGLSPAALFGTKRHGLQLNALRDGPLDKHGVGSGILDAQGDVNAKELARIRDFAAEKIKSDGSSELGLNLSELRAFMDANFERAAGRRRRIDRTLMNGEWAVLLKVMGRDDNERGRYLSVREVEQLFTNRRLPARMTDR